MISLLVIVFFTAPAVTLNETGVTAGVTASVTTSKVQVNFLISILRVTITARTSRQHFGGFRNSFHTGKCS